MDGRDIRAFTPVFDGLCPTMTILEAFPDKLALLRELAPRQEGGIFIASYSRLTEVDRPRIFPAVERPPTSRMTQAV